MIARVPGSRRIGLPKVEQRMWRILEPDDLQRLAEELGEQYEVLPYAAIKVGLRWGEAAGLRALDVDFLKRTVSVSLQWNREGKLAVLKTAASKRTVPISGSLVDVLGRQFARRGITIEDPEAFLFVAPDGGPLTTRTSGSGSGTPPPPAPAWLGSPSTTSAATLEPGLSPSEPTRKRSRSAWGTRASGRR